MYDAVMSLMSHLNKNKSDHKKLKKPDFTLKEEEKVEEGTSASRSMVKIVGIGYPKMFKKE